MPRKHIESVAYAPNGKFVVISGEDSLCTAYDPISGDFIQHMGRFGERDHVVNVSISADSRFVAICDLSDTLKIWDFANQRAWKHTFSIPDSVIFESAFCNDNRLLAASVFVQSDDDDTVVIIWNMETGEALYRLRDDHWGRHRRYLQFTADNRRLLVGFEWGGALLWDFTHDQSVDQFHLPRTDTWDVDLSPDETQILTVEGNIHIWDIASKSIVKTIEGYSPTAAKFSVDNHQLLIADTDHNVGFVVLYKLQSDQVVQKFIGHTNAIYAVTISPDGSRLLTGSYDCTARIWDVATGQELVCIDHRLV